VAPRRLSSAALQAHHSFYIDGKWVPPVQGVVPHEVINPATEQPIATIALGSPADVDAAVGAAQRALPSWSVTSREQRLAMLERLAAIYEARQGELARAISSEMGAPIRLATRAQAAAGLAHLRQFVRVLRGFDFERPLRVDRPAEMLAHCPIGVCALIAPWNWPMNQVCLKVAPALAAGCTAVLKPSELAPLSSLLFTEMIHEAGFPPGTFNLVQGEGAIVGEALAAHPAVDMVSFTGSARGGRAVTRAAGTPHRPPHPRLLGRLLV
jgi:aldehyde dehydrogenase (NAD+)